MLFCSQAILFGFIGFCVNDSPGAGLAWILLQDVGLWLLPRRSTPFGYRQLQDFRYSIIAPKCTFAFLTRMVYITTVYIVLHV